MVSARSTVSIARTTPAQKPRGEQSTIFRGGLAGIGRSRTESPSPARRERSIQIRTWDGFRALSRPVSKPFRGSPQTAYIEAIPVITDDHGFASKRWAKHKGDLP